MTVKNGTYLNLTAGLILLLPLAAVQAADAPPAYIQNEDSHPHQVAPGDSARFTVESDAVGARVDVKCSLEGDRGQPLAAVTLRTHGLVDVRWPFPTQTIRIDTRVDFDLSAQTQAGADGLPYFEFVNDDETRLLWHQCYNN